jgi:hypothetical protein
MRPSWAASARRGARPNPAARFRLREGAALRHGGGVHSRSWSERSALTELTITRAQELGEDLGNWTLQ